MEQKPKTKSPPFSWETTPTLYKNWRERFITPMLVGALILGLLALVPAIISARSPILDGIFIGVYALITLVTFIRFPYLVRITVFLLSVYILGVSELFATGILGDALFFFLALIVFSTMMISPTGGVGALAILLVTYTLTGWFSLSGRLVYLNPFVVPANLSDWLSASATTLLFGVVIILGLRQLQVEFIDAQIRINQMLDAIKGERDNLEGYVSERTRQLKKVNEIGRNVSSTLDLEELLARVVHLIGQEFECYYCAIFLLEPGGQFAELKEATGEAGKVLRENKYRLDVNGNNLVSIAIRLRRAKLSAEAEAGMTRAGNPLLPYTRSQISLPLIVGERVLGALDLQSTSASAFDLQDVDAFQNMANQVAIALENARLFKESEQSLAEMRATQKQYIQGSWATLASEQKMEYQLGDDDLLEGSSQIDIPLALRDQIIGQINMAGSHEWSPEQKNLIETIASQAALALENARLVEESQSTAARERLVNEITAKIWSSTNVDGILQTAVRELGHALEASEVIIKVDLKETES
jgi:GAF domain-containing protein